LRSASAHAKRLNPLIRKGGRAVYCSGLENRRARKGTVGSNPTPSAKTSTK
jgi:hypothetical protein